jgi:hypothetical protein
MRVDPIGPITWIAPITPNRKRRVTPKKEVKKPVISDDNLGRNVDIIIKGPLKAPNCYDCISYYVTQEPAFPHGCKMFGFKDSDLPSQEVYKSTRCHCKVFEQNPKIKK